MANRYGNLLSEISDLRQGNVRIGKFQGIINDGSFTCMNRKFGFESVRLKKVSEIDLSNQEGTKQKGLNLQQVKGIPNLDRKLRSGSAPKITNIENKKQDMK